MLSDETFHERLEAAIEAAETATSAELVVVLAPRSGSYRDVCYLGGGIVATAALLVMLFAPIIFHVLLIVPLTLAAFAVGAAGTSRVDALLRLLTTRHRRRRQVERDAAVAFHEEGLTATLQRNGLLIYFALLERDLVILPDLGIDGKVARAHWNALRQRVLQAADGAALRDALCGAVAECGRLLAEPFPPGEENPDEIPNTPRIRA